MEPTRNQPGLRHQEEAADHLQAERGRAVRDVPPQELRGAEAVLARGGRDADPAPGRDHRAVRVAAGCARSSWGCRTGGGSTCWRTSWTSRTGMIFNEFEGNLPETVAGDGDVKYHLGFSADHVTADKHTVHLTLTPNPSHLEAVNPVVEGRMRAKQRRFQDRDRRLGLPILIHGDAAFAGQGLVAETLNLSQLAGLQDRRHDPHRGEQPDRLHHRAQRGPVDPVLHRRRQDDRGADLPRQRRGPGGRGRRRRAGVRLPGRRSARTWSSTWSATGGTATTRATSRASPSRSCTRRSRTGSASASCTPSSS